MMREAVGFAMSLARSSVRSEGKVANTGSHDGDEGVDVELRSGASEGGRAGRGARGGQRARWEDARWRSAVAGGIGWLDSRYSSNSRGRVCDGASGRTREGHGVDAVDG